MPETSLNTVTYFVENKVRPLQQKSLPKPQFYEQSLAAVAVLAKKRPLPGEHLTELNSAHFKLIWSPWASFPGLRLGPYEILSSIGAEGMGEVYRARGTRLNRIVAIKSLTYASGRRLPGRSFLIWVYRAIVGDSTSETP